MTFGERLKQLRKAAGENQTDLAIMLGKPAAITVNVEISTLLDGNSVDLEYLRQAVKEKMERDARRC